MTTQSASIVMGNGMMSKIFNGTVTDGQWDGNVLTDSISSQSIGILIPNTKIEYAQANYQAGCMAWRVQNAQTLAVKARGLGNLDQLNCYASQRLASPITIGQNDILTTFTLPAAAAGESNTIAWIQTSKSTELFQAKDATVGTAKVLTSVVNSQTVGDLYFGSTLQRIWVQVDDGHALDTVQILDEMGGVVMTLTGGERGATGGSKSNQYKLYATNLGVRIGKGWTIQVKTAE